MNAVMLFLMVTVTEQPFDDWLTEAGYTFRRGGGYFATVRGRSLDWDRSSFSVPPNSDFERELRKFELDHYAVAPPTRPSPDYATKHPRNVPLPSGWPLGKARYYSRGTSSAQLVTFVEGNMVITQHHASLVNDGGAIRVRTTELNLDDAKILEMASRWLTAGYASEAYTATSATINGQNFSARRNAAGRVHIRAKDWAQRKGFTFRVNVGTACAVITRPSGDILLPLGSPKVKVGSTWMDIDDVVIADGNEVMLPKQILDRIGG